MHGRTSVDDYAWLCDTTRTNREVLAHLGAENEYAQEVMGDLGDLQEALFDEIRSRVKETDWTVPARRGSWWYFSRTERGKQYRRWCRVPVTDLDDHTPPDPDDPAVAAGEQVLLDGNVEAGSGSFFAVGVLEVSPDHRLLAWAVDRDGSEDYRLRFRDLDTGRDLDDEIADVYESGAWSADSRTFLYTRTDAAHRPHEVWRHTLGVAADARVHRDDDERFYVQVNGSNDGRWLLISSQSKLTVEVKVCAADDPAGTWRRVVGRDPGVEGWVATAGDTFYVRTNAGGATDFMIVAVDAHDPAAPVREVVAHVPGVRLEEHVVVGGSLAVLERTLATTRLRIVDLAKGGSWIVPQPEDVSAVELSANDDASSPFVRFSFTSLVTPPTTVDVDVRTMERHDRKEQRILGGFHRDSYVTSRVWATASDGERIPISVVHHVDRDGPTPTLLYGYGAYEISIDPWFESSRLSLLERGWSYAIAHVRGGGEMGRRWYLDGKLERKTNSFDDLIACGEALVAEGIADPDHLAVRGGSAGGLLVGAALNRAPRLWSAVVAEVPFVDALTTMLDPTLPLTVTEWEEWGDPITSPEIYDLMASYSPYDNVTNGVYPPVLATGGLHDPRVGYWEPAKWIAKLRSEARGGPFLLRTEMGAGHGGPSGRYDRWREEAMILTFLLEVSPES